ncbi:hypothetical protein H112_06588 [Trichophyton rubrum D6]|uniref:Uncharacterized protein n=3 Tax=Trichophyton TaxID=5550 RepID=A0A178F163_TRIRU|nr:hypothetical protein H100_06605 [Trichophyton rubrum MR850]EZF39234.1 hypothetical protein H102_06572 [Trichophyton rubrum CBS 100081]EZF49881.1 hypothetical protein H103_06597 [Trichophyton rubrum CBS 288.86]EZF60517.1 hypothetical protein H104_06552 [Trichophyton rubrum CBS 289.86]EZF71202.1 hypothetical protein H105_06609 [Trichophyton soudanense CBS 452.61]EZF81708.1 hypothetical protein H110_06592 [Trichophyton rubrum MR1448]KDB31067.1 hypothetical protein H112_06588 [Trichophyton rub
MVDSRPVKPRSDDDTVTSVLQATAKYVAALPSLLPSLLLLAFFPGSSRLWQGSRKLGEASRSAVDPGGRQRAPFMSVMILLLLLLNHPSYMAQNQGEGRVSGVLEEARDRFSGTGCSSIRDSAGKSLDGADEPFLWPLTSCL